MMPIAHSKNADGQQHHLLEHLKCVANMAAEFAGKFGARDLGYWSGIWHDVGKIHPCFQAYLRECEIKPDKRRYGPDHKLAGSIIADNQEGAGILAFLIAGHHGGAPKSYRTKGIPSTFQVLSSAVNGAPTCKGGRGLKRFLWPGMSPAPAPWLRQSDWLPCSNRTWFAK